ncbi:MAG TPA: hypothetical protein VFQ60_01945 [Patescibacteria group bacterium]|nr:hypothetical protein [Patescibacteria group bacterium]
MDAPHPTRHVLFEKNKTDLAGMAYDALQHGHTNTTCMLACIDMDDKNWRPLVNHLIPDYDWNFHERRSLCAPVLCVITVSLDYQGLSRMLVRMLPELASILSLPPPAGHFRVAVLGDCGISIYHVIPEQETTAELEKFYA